MFPTKAKNQMPSTKPRPTCFLGTPCWHCDFDTISRLEAATRSARLVFRPSKDRKIFKAEFVSQITPASEYSPCGEDQEPANLEYIFSKAGLSDRPILVGCRLNYGIMPDGGFYMMHWHALFERPRPWPLRKAYARLNDAIRGNSPRFVRVELGGVSAYGVGRAVEDVFGFTWPSIPSLVQAQLADDQKELIKRLKEIPSANRLWGKNLFRDNVGCWYRFDVEGRSNTTPEAMAGNHLRLVDGHNPPVI